MARKQHLINVHTSTGTTAPTGASLYLGEIAVQHTENEPALWIKVGTAQTSTEYEKFIGQTEINNEFNKTNHNIPYVVQNGDTYTGSCSDYEATCDELTQLVDGQSIIFHPKQQSKTGNTYTASSCTLKITLADGTEAGPDILYLRRKEKITTHILGCTDIKLTYHDNATWSGVTGLKGWWPDFYYDSNSDVLAHGIYYANTQRVVTSQMYRYRLMFSSADEKYWVPANSATSTNATSVRSATTTPIDPFGPIAYYATATVISSGASPGGSAAYTQYSAVTLGYSFVFADSAMTAKLPVYLKCEPQTDGSAIIDATAPIVQELPLTEDGKIYIFLGVAISATVFQLYEQHPVYEYKYGHIRQYQEDNAPEMILGSAYTYSGLSYVNSSTTLADAYSALTQELFDDELVVSSALNTINDRLDNLILGPSYTYSGLPYVNSATTVPAAYSALTKEIINDELVVSRALNSINGRLGILAHSATMIADAYSALTKEVLDDEEAIAAGFNGINDRLVVVEDSIAHNTGVTQLSGAVVSLSAATTGISDELLHLSAATRTLSSATQSLSGAVRSVSARTSGVLTFKLNGVQQGKYSPSANTTINQVITGDNILLTGYKLASGTTELELAVGPTDSVNVAFGKLQKQNYDNETIIASCLNNLNERIYALSGETESTASAYTIALNNLSGEVLSVEYVVAQSLNNLDNRIAAIADLLPYIPKALTLSSAPTTAITTIAGLEAIGLSASEVEAYVNGLRTVVKIGGTAYSIWGGTYSNATNFSINFGTVVYHTTGTLQTVESYTEYIITSTNGTVSVSVRS